MASETASPESALDAIRTSGFYCEKNPVIGDEIARMEREDFTLLSKDGLEFYEANVLNNEVGSSLCVLVSSGLHVHQRVRSVLDSRIPDFGLARCRHIHSDPGHRFRFRKAGKGDPPKAIVVMLWEKLSAVTFFRGSHRLDLRCAPASNGLFEVVPAAQLELGKAEWFNFEHGGLCVKKDLVVHMAGNF